MALDSSLAVLVAPFVDMVSSPIFFAEVVVGGFMGLAPQLVAEIFDIVRRLHEEEGVSFLLAEQNTTAALQVADYGYILENGRVVLDCSAETLRQNEDVKEFYLGLGAAGRRSYRDVKHYRRRKRWLA